LFVGRSRELRSLATLASAAQTNGPAAAVVVAEPGLGKTRLLEELVDGLELPVVRLHGYEPAREIPLGAAGGLLRVLMHVEDAGPRLEGLLFGEAAAGADLGTVRVFEAAFRCLEVVGPLAVVVDDVQWVDEETLALLHYVLSAARPAGLPLLLVCASRPAAEAEALSAALGSLLADESYVALTLGPLDEDEGVELALLLAPHLDRARAEGLWRRAQGSPFWLEALAGAAGADASPAGLIRARFAALDVEAARLFALLVVAARPLALVDAAELLGWPEERAGMAAGGLANRALVVREAGSARIAHDLIREAAERDLPEAEERRLHGVLAEWLERTGGDELQLLFRALEHRQAAGLAAEELALRIAGSPQRRLLGGEGLATLAGIADAALDGLLLQREVAALASELGEWAVAFERWGALAERAPGAAERAQAALGAASAAFRLGRAPDVHAFVARARALVPDEPVLAIEADVQEAQSLLWLENRARDAEPVIARALATVERSVENAGGVDRLDDAERRAHVRALRARLDAAIRDADSVAVARWADLVQAAASDPVEALAAASDGVFATLQLEGRPKPAESRARQALEESRRLALPSLEVEATHWVGLIAHHRGRLDEAAELLQQAVSLAERVGPPRRFHITQLRAMRHSVEASRGDWRRASGGIADSIADEPDPHYRMVIWTLRVWLAGRFGSPGDGQLEKLLTPMAEDAEVAACGRCLWESVLHGAEALARLGDVEGAEAALDRWDSANPKPPAGPQARRAYTGALLESRRRRTESLALFASARELAERAGHDLMCLWIDLDAAIALSAVDRTGAIASLRMIAQHAEVMGARSEQQLAVRELRRLGIRTWRRRGAGGPLTARELEIARLVAAGESNPDIASALFLSRKTVERHVSNILNKMGARNRTELAALLARKGAGAAG
jgi:DNA-binding CsgD family transcriptional regulator